MAGSVNKVVLIGHLGKDPEVRTTQSGSKIVNLTVATSESWSDRASGERKERTEWHRVVIFNERLADVAERFLRKGRKVYLEGALETRKWTDQAGVEKYSTEIVLKNFRGEIVLLDRGDDDSGDKPARERAPVREGTKEKPGPKSADWETSTGDLDDEVPF